MRPDSSVIACWSGPGRGRGVQEGESQGRIQCVQTQQPHPRSVECRHNALYPVAPFPPSKPIPRCYFFPLFRGILFALPFRQERGKGKGGQGKR